MKNNLTSIIAEIQDILEVSDEAEKIPEHINKDYLRGVSTVAKEILKKLKDCESELREKLENYAIIEVPKNKTNKRYISIQEILGDC